MANTYTFQRRAIYWEEEIVYADSVEEARDMIQSGDGGEIYKQDFLGYLQDDEFELIEEKINDPLVDMVTNYDNYRQMEFAF